MKRICLFLFFSLTFYCRLAHAQLGEIGIYPLDLQNGARPLGMGAAFSGLADDVNCILYNPGGMAWAKGISLTFRDFDNITAVQAYPTGYGSSLGLAVVTSKILDVPVTGGVANSDSNILVLSFGTKLNFLPLFFQQPALQRLGIGLNLKGLLTETLRRTGRPDRSATGWDMDLGLLWKGTDWWSAGITLQNILPIHSLSGGGTLKWDVGGEEGFPATEKIGFAAKIIGDLGSPIYREGSELIAGGELNFSRLHPTFLRLGGEWGLDKTYFLRAGIMQQYKPGEVSAAINLGAGYRNPDFGLDIVSYRDPLRQEAQTYISVLYFPKEWVVVKKLEVEKPGILLETALEKISLEDNIVTYNDRIDVFGKVKAGVEVYVNGLRAYTAEDNTFKVVIPLQPEKNLIVVEARYEGEKKVWKYKVLRKAKVVIAEEKQIEQQLKKALTPEEKEALRKKEQEIKERRSKVEELVTLGVIEVSPEAEFKLQASVTRGEMATWLAKSTGLPLPKVERNLFLDVKRDHPLAPFIKLVVDWDLLKPYPDGTFRPEASVSKEEGEKLFKILKVKG